MKIYKTAKELTSEIDNLKGQNKKIGFVPTMGALHKGHLSLIEKSLKENDVTVVSIFVNPIQFNNKTDLKRYPRILDKDIEILKQYNVDYLFAPDEKEMYPEGTENIRENYDFGQLDKILEGKFRPGHFKGVAIVVKRLFDIVKPHNAYFGKKDYQQLLIIKELVKQTKLPINIVPIDIVREHNGLAMSSRNMLLSQKEREQASFIYQALLYGKKHKGDVGATKEAVVKFLKDHNLTDLEYFEICNKETLQPLSLSENKNNSIALIAINCCGVRLIDNMEY